MPRFVAWWIPTFTVSGSNLPAEEPVQLPASRNFRPVARKVSPDGRAGHVVTAARRWGCAVSALASLVACSGADSVAPTPSTAIALVGLSAGGSTTCGLGPAGKAYCWGENNSGQLGTGVMPGRPTCGGIQCNPAPVPVAGGFRFRALGTGGLHTCGVTDSDKAYCWGNNRSGQLGIGSPEGPQVCPGLVGCSPTPIEVPSLPPVAAIVVGLVHTCGLTRDGVAYCWGSNTYGQLGTGSTTGPEYCPTRDCSTTPIAVTGALRFQSLSAGDFHTCGIEEDGTTYCWGGNAHGELGIGETPLEACNTLELPSECSPTPIAVIGSLRFVTLASGGPHACSLTSSGQAFCWGSNSWGTLGIGVLNGPELCGPYLWPCSRSPMPIAGELKIRNLTAGGDVLCATTDAGAAWCWGRGRLLGDGDHWYVNSTPVQVAGNLSFLTLDSGSFHTCGITREGVSYCWGDNEAGQLGNGSKERSGIPVAIAEPANP